MTMLPPPMSDMRYAQPFAMNGGGDGSPAVQMPMLQPGSGGDGGDQQSSMLNALVPNGTAAAGAPAQQVNPAWQTSGLQTPAAFQPSSGYGPMGGNWPNQSGTGTMNLPSQNGQVTTVQAPTTNQAMPAYTQAVWNSLQPTFQTQQNQLSENLAAKGILSSGAASKNFQDLYGQQGATVAGQVAPLIQQGFQNQNQAASQNANAANSYQQLIQQQAFGAGQQGINNNLQAQEFNAGQQQQLQLAQMGYGNADYMQMIAQLGGLTGMNQGAQNGINSQGMNNQLGAYTNSYNSMLPYYYGQGQSQGYNPMGQGSPFSMGPGGVPTFGSATQPGQTQTIGAPPAWQTPAPTGTGGVPDVNVNIPTAPPPDWSNIQLSGYTGGNMDSPS